MRAKTERVSVANYPSWCCQKCGAQIGWVGRFFQFSFWLPQIVNICCKYRGYKSSVLARQLLISGSLPPNKMEPTSSIDRDESTLTPSTSITRGELLKMPLKLQKTIIEGEEERRKKNQGKSRKGSEGDLNVSAQQSS